MKKTKMLKKNYEFKKVLTKGKYFSGKYLEIFIKRSKNEEEKVNFLGIAISVKLAKAVKRNYIKRLIREVYQKIENEIDLGYEIVILCKKKADIDKIRYNDVNIDMKSIFEKANIL